MLCTYDASYLWNKGKACIWFRSNVSVTRSLLLHPSKESCQVDLCLVLSGTKGASQLSAGVGVSIWLAHLGPWQDAIYICSVWVNHAGRHWRNKAEKALSFRKSVQQRKQTRCSTMCLWRHILMRESLSKPTHGVRFLWRIDALAQWSAKCGSGVTWDSQATVRRSVS